MYDHVELEESILKEWEKKKTMEKALRKRKKKFFFMEGPPTLNAEPHVGHMRGRTIKDVVIRYKILTGHKVWNKAGWDCQGLPVELQVEKKLGMKSKKEIEEYGVDKFIQECRKLVLSYKPVWEDFSKRLGMWLDFKHAYMTMDDEYIEYVWSFVKKAHERGLLTQNYRTTAWCPRCQTSLSGHEVAQGYQKLEDPSIFVVFKTGQKNLLVWTTTPWTLVANVALTVDPERTYVEVESEMGNFVVGKEFLPNLQFLGKVKVLREFKGEELVGEKYEPIIKLKKHAEFENAFTIIPSDLISVEKGGTGIVHIAPGCGPEDFDLGIKHGLPIFSPVDESGRYTEEADRYKGLFVLEANERIIEDLKKEGKLIHETRIVHDYPTCWRCHSRLIFRASKQWFIKIDPIREKMIEENAKVHWIPEAVKNRFESWLRNARDWNISRQRYWGTPLPIWICERCGKVEVFGSKKELEKRAKAKIKELHKPYVDVEIDCACGGKMRRVKDVADVWMDSGCAIGASLGEKVKELFPADFITEGTDQTRGWYYTLMLVNTIMYGKAPYKTVLNQGFVLDERGKKMSKSEGNVIWAREIFESIGADVYRFYVLWKNDVWDSINFSLTETKIIKRMLNVFWNMHLLLKELMDKFRIRGIPENLEKEDKWILSKTQRTIELVTRNMEEYDLTKASRLVYNYILEDLSRGYIQLVRERIHEDERVANILHYCLRVAATLLAPFSPFIAEKVYKEITGQESVFFENWPEPDPNLVFEMDEKDVEVALKLISEINAIRERIKRGVRWPIKRAIIVTKNESILNVKEIIERQTNVKEVSVERELPPFAKLQTKVNYERLKEKFGEKKIPVLMRKLIEISPEALLKKNFPVKLEVDGEMFEIEREDVEIIPTAKGFECSRSDFGYILVDLEMTDELLREGFAREIVRKIQDLRKKLGLKRGKRVKVFIEGIKLPEFKEFMEKRTTSEIEFGKAVGEIRRFKIKDKEIKIGIEL